MFDGITYTVGERVTVDLPYGQKAAPGTIRKIHKGDGMTIKGTYSVQLDGRQDTWLFTHLELNKAKV